MVETRRTSRRLQAKVALSTPPRKTQDKESEESEESAQEIPVTTDEEEVVAIASDTESEETQEKPQHEEDDIMLLDDEEEEDVDHYVRDCNVHVAPDEQLRLPRRKLHQSAVKPSTAALKRRLVPNQLDSGASQFKEFFAFDGTKHATAAALRADARAAEEANVVAAGQKEVAHSERQRAEALHKKSAGRRWFNFESEDMSEDARRDFALLRMRNYLDPKKFYKSSDHSRALPKHFQMGVVVEGAHEFHSARLTKKQRRKTFTDEIMADGDIVEYTTRVASNIQRARSSNGRKNKKRRRN
ncbi:hypothetical protein KRP22_014739 [Phytophthora ramorum]|nr:rRNA-processing protein fcf2 [Phytophthora ramorum]